MLGTLECNDTDGDRVGYKLTSGTAVRVNFNGTVTLAVPLDFEVILNNVTKIQNDTVRAP